MNKIRNSLSPAALLTLCLLMTQPALAAPVPDAWLEQKLAQEQVTTPLSAQDVDLLKRSAQLAVKRVQERAVASVQGVIAYVDIFMQSRETPVENREQPRLGHTAQRLVLAMRNPAPANPRR